MAEIVDLDSFFDDALSDDDATTTVVTIIDDDDTHIPWQTKHTTVNNNNVTETKVDALDNSFTFTCERDDKLSSLRIAFFPYYYSSIQNSGLYFIGLFGNVKYAVVSFTAFKPIQANGTHDGECTVIIPLVLNRQTGGGGGGGGGGKKRGGGPQNKVHLRGRGFLSFIGVKTSSEFAQLNAVYVKNSVTVCFGNRNSAKFNLTLSFPFDIENPNVDLIQFTTSYQPIVYWHFKNDFEQHMWKICRIEQRSAIVKSKFDKKRKWTEEHKEIVVATIKKRVVNVPEGETLSKEQLTQLSTSNRRMFFIELFKTMYSWVRRDKTTGAYRQFVQPVSDVVKFGKSSGNVCSLCLKGQYDHEYPNKTRHSDPIIIFGKLEFFNQDYLHADYENFCYVTTAYKEANNKNHDADHAKKCPKIKLQGYLIGQCITDVSHFVITMMNYTAMNLIKDEQINFHMLSFLSDFNLCGCKSCCK